MTTIAEWIATAHVHRTELGERTAYHARKALLRITDAGETTPTSHAPADPLAAHRALNVEAGARQLREERTHLERLLAHEPIPAELGQRIFRGEATLADATRALTLNASGTTERRDPRVSALNKVIRVLSTAGDGSDVPAARKALDTRLARLSQHDLGVKPASLRTIKSQARSAAGGVDMQGRQRLQASMLTGDWAALVHAIREKRASPATSRKHARELGHHEGRIWPLVDHAWRHGIAAADVDDTTVQDLRHGLESRGFARPFETARNVVYAWEWLQAAVPGWPARTLSRLYAAGSPVHETPFDALPPALRQSWATYADRVFTETRTTPDRHDLTACVAQPASAGGSNLAARLADLRERNGAGSGAEAVSAQTRKPAQAPNFRTVITHAANAAIHDLGRTPETLTDLMDEDVLMATLQRQHTRQIARAEQRGTAPPAAANATLKATVTTFKALARDLGMPEETVAAFDCYYDAVHPDFLRWTQTSDGPRRQWRNRRIGPTHAAMLEQFSRDGGRAKLLAWFTLPRTLLDRVESRLRAVRGDAGRLSERELNDAMTAVVAAILQCCPLRRENLAELRLGPDHASGLGPNLYVPGTSERNRAARIALADHEVKNNQGMTVLASDLATRALRFYRDRIRPEVLRRRGSDPANPYLFPGRGRAERPHTKHTRDYRDRAWAAGFWLDLHCNRHLTAKIVLDRDPTAMPLVQTILGHANQRTTEAYYAEVNQILAQERFQQHLAAAESELTAELGTAIRNAQA